MKKLTILCAVGAMLRHGPGAAAQQQDPKVDTQNLRAKGVIKDISPDQKSFKLELAANTTPITMVVVDKCKVSINAKDAEVKHLAVGDRVECTCAKTDKAGVFACSAVKCTK